MVEKYQRVIDFGILGWVIEEDLAHRKWVGRWSGKKRICNIMWL